MQHFDYVIRDEIGLHARPAGLLVQEARKYKSRITLSANGKTVEATRLMALMGMCVKCGTSVSVEIIGEDENSCAAALKAFFEQNL